MSLCGLSLVRCSSTTHLKSCCPAPEKKSGITPAGILVLASVSAPPSLVDNAVSSVFVPEAVVDSSVSALLGSGIISAELVDSHLHCCYANCSKMT